tara:strand:- start:4302 stop:4622 length:321 start_codon:yes stop_codon:yes gene_type:complete
MTQDDLFSSTEGDKQKRIGMGRAADVQFELLQTARAIGREVAIRRGEVTTDDVGQELKRRGLPDCLGHAAGSIFKSKEFEWSGRFKNSERISNHSRLLRVWILKAR